MTKKVEFTVPDEIWELAEKACLSDDIAAFNRTLYLNALAAEYGARDDDETMKRIEKVLERFENL